MTCNWFAQITAFDQTPKGYLSYYLEFVDEHPDMYCTGILEVPGLTVILILLPFHGVYLEDQSYLEPEFEW